MCEVVTEFQNSGSADLLGTGIEKIEELVALFLRQFEGFDGGLLLLLSPKGWRAETDQNENQNTEPGLGKRGFSHRQFLHYGFRPKTCMLE